MAHRFLAQLNMAQPEITFEIDQRDGEVRVRASSVLLGDQSATNTVATNLVNEVRYAMLLAFAQLLALTEHDGGVNKQNVDKLANDTITKLPGSKDSTRAQVIAAARGL